ncbi:rhomboid family intramembrane serine protease [Enterovirga rhinocerotis]|uniref:rhomboid family intramembrane serine protease n=1 Tax=Enterovirga rhinocerotis TaxID=1339210 RepID=UPI001FDEF480|nr:rhomboid family intramembrane serine protease [Enterovirga rhinocerotis]
MPIVTRREPAINIPAFLVAWIGLLVVIHAVRTLVLSDDTDLRLLLETAFIPAPWSVASGYASGEAVIHAAAAAQGGAPAELRIALARYFAAETPRLWSPLSYAFLHGSWTHLGLNCLWLVAFGTSVVRRAGTSRSVILGVAAALGGALAQWLSSPLGTEIVIGASASVSGFMAAAATFMYARPGDGRWAFLANRGALIFIGVWLVANLIFGFIAVPLGMSDGDVAWQAHIGGLVVGLLLFPLLDPFHREPSRAFGS